MRYQVAPLEDSSVEPSPEWRRLQQSGETWWYFTVHDDVGTEHWDQHGSTGFMGPNQSVFDSNLDFEPAVPQEATSLEVSCFNWSYPEQSVFTLKADVAIIEEEE